MMRLRKVEAIKRNIKGKVIGFHLGADAANDDWIRAGRLKKEGKLKELEELENTEMYQIVDEKKTKKTKRDEANSN